ncbi:DUF6894 family protein [Aminobacter carboxidus]|uniref:DUF6894 family protein n=1 Tax=Aminobacter carboxidus TaxID=376165 RepID=UPI001FE9914F|nr:hypothetical protein [Aminobacter carboxidus]
MQVTRTEIEQDLSAEAYPILRVMFKGEGGECVIVDMADVDALAGDEEAAIERAKAVLVQTATFDTAVNDYDAQSNGNFDQVTKTQVTDRDGGIYVFEYRDGDGSRRVPPSTMPSLEAAREEALRCAVELLADLDLNTGPIPDWLIRIYDGHGNLLAVVDVHQADAARQTTDRKADSGDGS